MVMVHNQVQSHVDRSLILYLIALIVFGLFSLASATVVVGFNSTVEQNSFWFVTRQILYGLLPGIVLFLITARLDYHIFKKTGWLLYGFLLVSLVLIFTPLGVCLKGSCSWLNLGFTTFQPAEAAKFISIVIIGYLLADTKRNWQDWKNQLVPVLAVIGLPIALILLQKDLGTALIILCIVAVLLVLGKVPLRYLMTVGLLSLFLVVVMIAGTEHRRERIMVFWSPEKHTNDDIGFQIFQSKIAVGSGGVWGVGYGNSRQKFSYIPEVNSDSVFPIIGEELGFIGSCFLIGLIILISYRGLKIAAHAPDQFGQFLAAGVVTWFAGQSFLNIGGIIGAIPLTGVPLPLVSHGGSAYMMMLAGFGVLVSVSRQSKLS